MPSRVIPPEKSAKIREMLLGGNHTRTQIASVCHTGVRTVDRMAEALGIEPETVPCARRGTGNWSGWKEPFATGRWGEG